MGLSEEDINDFVNGSLSRNEQGLHSEGDLIVIALHSSLAEAQAQLESYNKYCKDEQAYEGPQFWTDRIESMERSLAEARDELERLKDLRNNLASLYDENEPHEMGGPHISLLYVVDRMDGVELDGV